MDLHHPSTSPRCTVSRLVIVISLLLTLAAGVVWVRSYWVLDTLFYERHGTRPTLHVGGGRIAFDYWHVYPEDLGWRYARQFDHVSYPPAPTLYPTVRYVQPSPLSNIRHWRATMPLWLLCLFCSLPLWLQARRWFLRRRRQSHNLCVRCGYDLRATPERCPECGTSARELAIDGGAGLEPSTHRSATTR